MRGISPIVSTILMVAIAIAAAVVVYYITMDVVTQQGAQLQEQASKGSAPAIRIVAVSFKTDGDKNIEGAADTLDVYYTLLNTDKNNIKDLGGVAVYLTYNVEDNIVCVLSGTELNLDTAGVIKLANDLNKECEANLPADKTYYVYVTAGNAAPSNKYKVVAQ